MRTRVFFMSSSPSLTFLSNLYSPNSQYTLIHDHTLLKPYLNLVCTSYLLNRLSSQKRLCLIIPQTCSNSLRSELLSLLSSTATSKSPACASLVWYTVDTIKDKKFTNLSLKVLDMYGHCIHQVYNLFWPCSILRV